MWRPEDEISIAIVEDHPIVVEGLRKIVTGEFNIREVTSFAAGDEFILFLKSGKTFFDIVLLDISMPGKSGIELCGELKKLMPATRILAFSNHSERSVILQMLQNGASGYLLKNASATDLVGCMKEALRGQLAISDEVKNIISQPGQVFKAVAPLTKREKEILRLIADGKTSVEIADQLFVSPLTIETHRRNLMQKFDVSNVAELVKVAKELQFL